VGSLHHEHLARFGESRRFEAVEQGTFFARAKKVPKETRPHDTLFPVLTARNPVRAELAAIMPLKQAALFSGFRLFGRGVSKRE